MSASNILSSIFKTPGVSNIENAYTRAGGHANGLPGHKHATTTIDDRNPAQDPGDNEQSARSDKPVGSGKGGASAAGGPEKNEGMGMGDTRGSGSERFAEGVMDARPEVSLGCLSWVVDA